MRSRRLKSSATCLGYITPLMPALTLDDADGIVNCTIAFITSRWLKSGETSLLVMWQLALASMILLHSLHQHSQNEVQCNIFGHVMPLVPALEDNQNQVQHDFLYHMKTLVPVWYPVMPVAPLIPPLHLLRWLKVAAMWDYLSCVFVSKQERERQSGY